MIRSIRGGSIVACTLLALTRAAAAQDDAASAPSAPAPMGHIPLLDAGFSGGFSTVPYARPDRTGCTEDCDDGVFQGVLTLDARLNLDLGKVLFIGQGSYSPAGGDLEFIGRADVVFGSLLGGRGSTSLWKPIGGYSTATEDVTITKVYANEIPVFYGVVAGTTVYGMRDGTDSTADITPVPMKPGGALATVEVGLAAVTAQEEILVAPTYEVTTGTVGFRWEWRIAFPFGRYPFYFRMAGDHFFGSAADERFGQLLVMGIGLGSSLGVSAD
jgi:hypothetical protein